MGTIVIRTAILYILILIVMRIMGKRQLGELQPFELVITLIIANLAQTPLSNTGVPLLYGVLPILSLFLIHELSAYLVMKSNWINKFLSGKPTLIISKGVILEQELRKMRYTVSDLLEQLRVQQITEVQDVEYAILETNGELSIVPRSEKRQLTPQDMNLSIPAAELVATVIIDGKLIEQNIAMKNRTKEWLLKQLGKARLQASDVLLAQLGDKVLKIQIKHPNTAWRIVEVGK